MHPKTLQQWVERTQTNEQTQTFDATAIAEPDPYEAGVQLVEFGALDEAQTMWGAAAEAGDTEAAFTLGVLLVRRGEHDEAETWWRRAAEAGNTTAAFNLGLLLKRRGDLDGAVQWSRAAAEAGNIDAANNLGLLLASYSEPLRRLEPAVRRLAEMTDTHEVDALVKLIDRLPRLVNAMDMT